MATRMVEGVGGESMWCWRRPATEGGGGEIGVVEARVMEGEGGGGRMAAKRRVRQW